MSTSNRVAFADDPTIVGTLVPSPPWDVDGWPHVVWDGDEYVCVLHPSEIVLDTERMFG